VSILWGLVTYTKQTGKSSELDSRSATEPFELGEKEVSRGTYEDAPPLTLIPYPNVSQGNVDSILQSVREKQQLRALTAMESGKRVAQIPTGTYFFTIGAGIDSYLSQLGTFQLGFNQLKVQRFRESFSYVEIHYPYDKEPNIIFYMDEISFSRISQLSGAKQHETMAAFAPWRDKSIMVALPISRILQSTHRVVQLTNDSTCSVLDLLVR
jgi:hypothetical protein